MHASFRAKRGTTVRSRIVATPDAVAPSQERHESGGRVSIFLGQFAGLRLLPRPVFNTIFSTKYRAEIGMPHTILAEVTASVSELKKNPMGTVAAGEGFPVAILNHNEPAFYCVPAKAFEAMMDRLEDIELNAIADARKDEPRIPVNLDDI